MIRKSLRFILSNIIFFPNPLLVKLMLILIYNSWRHIDGQERKRRHKLQGRESQTEIKALLRVILKERSPHI